jgi:hypothetical protein
MPFIPVHSTNSKQALSEIDTLYVERRWGGNVVRYCFPVILSRASVECQ